MIWLGMVILPLSRQKFLSSKFLDGLYLLRPSERSLRKGNRLMTENERFAWLQLAFTPHIGAESFGAVAAIGSTSCLECAGRQNCRVGAP